MIILVTRNQELFQNPEYITATVEDSIKEISNWDVIQFDTETTGRNPHICDILCAQFGNDTADKQIVVDCTTVNIELYKDLLENKLLIGQNLKFDLQFLYKHNIVPLKVYDTMIVEQLLYLGYPYLKMSPMEYDQQGCTFPYLEEEIKEERTGNLLRIDRTLSYSLKAILHKRLGIEMDKTVRGEIQWRGLDTAVIKYAAGDVIYLERIKASQENDLRKQELINAATVENNFLPAISYLEWSGIRLDEEGWKKKMEEDQKALADAKKALDSWIMNNPDTYFQKFVFQDPQIDLFEGLKPPECIINWSSSTQVLPIFKYLGFNTETADKENGGSKDSVMEKVLKTQRNLSPDFFDMYFKYKEMDKLTSTYGQTYLDAINPITGRIHTSFKQLGAASGRMSCGSKQEDEDLTKYKKLPTGRHASYVQIQNLPADERTRSLFISEPGNLFTSADYSALELVKYYLFN